MYKKYKLTEKTKNDYGNTLYRIQATKNFSNVKAGDLGGWVESESNLSQEGDCWISGNACVCENARVYENALVYGDVQVCGNTKVHGNSQVYGNSWIYENARVCGNAKVYGDTRIYGEVWIYGKAKVYGKAIVCENANICKNAEVSGNAKISGNAVISKSAIVKNENDLICIFPIGNKNKPVTFYRTKKGISVAYDYFNGSLDDFKQEVVEDYFNKDYVEKLNLAMQLAQLSIMC